MIGIGLPLKCYLMPALVLDRVGKGQYPGLSYSLWRSFLSMPVLETQNKVRGNLSKVRVKSPLSCHWNRCRNMIIFLHHLSQDKEDESSQWGLMEVLTHLYSIQIRKFFSYRYTFILSSFLPSEWTGLQRSRDVQAEVVHTTEDRFYRQAVLLWHRSHRKVCINEPCTVSVLTFLTALM